MTAGVLDPLPARSNGLDNVDGGPNCRVYIQMRGIEQAGVLGGPQRGDRPAAVPLVPAQDVGQDPGLVRRLPPAPQLRRAAAGPLLGAGGDENLNGRPRADHGADVAAVEHRPRRLGRELALEWIESDDEQIANAGWSTYGCLVSITPDANLDRAEIESLFDRIKAFRAVGYGA